MPAVMFAVDVVKFQSMRVAVLWKWLYLVGVVIVVWRPFVSMNLVILLVGVSLRRFRFMSPCMSIVVRGVRCLISRIMFCRSGMNVLSAVLGRLYRLMTVLLASVLACVLCICMMVVCTCRMYVCTHTHFNPEGFILYTPLP